MTNCSEELDDVVLQAIGAGISRSLLISESPLQLQAPYDTAVAAAIWAAAGGKVGGTKVIPGFDNSLVRKIASGSVIAGLTRKETWDWIGRRISATTYQNEVEKGVADAKDGSIPVESGPDFPVESESSESWERLGLGNFFLLFFPPPLIEN